MILKIDKFQVYTFYRFTSISNTKKIKNEIEDYIEKIKLRGTILLAEEGINGSISGEEKDLKNLIVFIKRILNIRKLEIKINKANFLPFNKIKIRLKKEIVSLGKNFIDTLQNTGKKISPKDWDHVINNKDYKIIDTRNKFEIAIGSFKNSINPKTKSFRDFPKNFQKLKIEKHTKIAMFCTGGIRCEKASSYLKQVGYENIFQLDGGILNYLDYKHKSKNNKSEWYGECFVFDNRVTVNEKLKMGKYSQCYGCRHPITKSDKKLKSYVKGVSCRYCYKIRTKQQLSRSLSRQIQINTANQKKRGHSF